MFEKEKGLFDAFVAKKMSRRELINGAGKLGRGVVLRGDEGQHEGNHEPGCDRGCDEDDRDRAFRC